MKAIRGFFRREPVLCIAALCAAASMLAVPPGPAYRDYVDLRVLCLLFCLMAVVAGLQDCGLFERLAQRLLGGCRRTRPLLLTLVLLPFFASMLVTNDVALLSFVPFGLLVLELAGRRELRVRTVVLQTVAANLGSMATPVGNPQNLFLCAHYQLAAGAFFAAVLPVTLASLLALLLAVCLWSGREPVELGFRETPPLRHPGRLALYAVLFGLCLLTVFRVLPYPLLTGLVLLALLLVAPGLLRRVDYGLLATFVCFFVFAGNLGQLPAVRETLASLLARGALLPSALASQVVSNVPAAVLLSGFTEDWRGLLLGTDIGGLGTPVASLASLISLKLYLGAPEARGGRYLLAFTLLNLAGLALLLPLALLLL